MTGGMILKNHILIATPAMKEKTPELSETVIYICDHHQQGTVGLILNQPLPFEMKLVFEQLKIKDVSSEAIHLPVWFGGPLQPERGFVLHRPSGQWKTSLKLSKDVTITTSNDIIRAIAKTSSPSDSFLALGYVGWDPIQLEQEILNDSMWLIGPFIPELLYDIPYEERWLYAGKSIGVDMTRLSFGQGYA